MDLSVTENGDIMLKKVYTGVILQTRDGENLGICMRDSGFEFNYEGVWYSAQQGVIQKMHNPSLKQEEEIATGQPLM